jgi:hypothetical protein
VEAHIRPARYQAGDRVRLVTGRMTGEVIEVQKIVRYIVRWDQGDQITRQDGYELAKVEPASNGRS